MDKVQLIASLNARYAANRALAAQVARRRAADFIDKAALRGTPMLRSSVVEESRRSAA